MAMHSMKLLTVCLLVSMGLTSGKILLRTTLLERGLKKINKTIASSSSSIPVPEKLFMAGVGTGSGQLKKAKELKKVEGKNQFSVTATLKSGGILFIPSKDSWDGAIGAEESTLERATKYCKYCGLDGLLKLSGDPGASDIPGPTRRGKYKVVVDFDKGTIKYSCAANCWAHSNPTDDLFVVGPAVCDGPDSDWKLRKGPKMDHEEGSQLYSKVVKLCPVQKGRKGFKLFRYDGKQKDDVGLWGGSWKIEQSTNMALGGKGYLKQWKDKSIPGPAVEAKMRIDVDMEAGTITMTCEDGCSGASKATHESFEPENPLNTSNDAFVHLFAWRWTDVATECENWLGPKGVKAVQIAPPQESKVPAPGKHDSWNYNYRPVSYKLESRMGNEEEFKDMIERCNRSGVEIYVDAVINHMAGGAQTSSGGTKWGRRSFPETGYEPGDFHHFEDDDLDNCRLPSENCDHECELKCDFNGMPDLDTSSEKVQGILSDYLNKCVDYGVGGFRIDAADHIGADDLSKILANVKPKYRFFETHYGEDLYALGAVTEFSYRNKLMKILMKQSQDLKDLRFLGEAAGLAPSRDAVVFVVNHDQVMTNDKNGAGIIYKQPVMYTLANVVMLALPYGYPKVISSFYFPDGAPQYYAMPVPSVHGLDGQLRCGDGANWVCEHRWPAIANMFRWRKHAASTITEFYSVSKKAVYFCRGSTACIIINASDEPLTIKPKLTLAAGEYCNIMVSDDPIQCPRTKVLADGTTEADVIVPALSTLAFHDGAAILAI